MKLEWHSAFEHLFLWYKLHHQHTGPTFRLALTLFPETTDLAVDGLALDVVELHFGQSSMPTTDSSGSSPYMVSHVYSSHHTNDECVQI